MCHLCSAVRPFDPDCPYTGEKALAEQALRQEAQDRLEQIEALDLDIADVGYLFGNAEPEELFDPLADIGFPENDPTGFGFGLDIPSGTGTWA